ncbi:unnamed protein product [Rotaria socialis]|uniref:Uncharacterized protein n=1 Tax=Rotaria socialis TaxID=392032 RepID=A0A820IDU3_9BILA|nr:unnamed protein product [Rotaria socialis]
MGDVIENVFRPTSKRQETLLQEIINKLDRENCSLEAKKLNENETCNPDYDGTDDFEDVYIEPPIDYFDHPVVKEASDASRLRVT